MGVRVRFWLGAPDGVEGVFWDSEPRCYRDWAWSVAEDCGFTVEFLCRLDRVVDEGPGGLTPVDRADAELVDAILDEFVGSYCDFEPRGRTILRPAVEAMLYARNFETARAEVDAYWPPGAAACWGHLLDGRASGRPPGSFPYAPRDPVFRLGYWTEVEVEAVHRALAKTRPAVARRQGVRAAGGRAEMPNVEVAFEVVYDAATRALAERTGLILTVS